MREIRAPYLEVALHYESIRGSRHHLAGTFPQQRAGNGSAANAGPSLNLYHDGSSSTSHPQGPDNHTAPHRSSMTLSASSTNHQPGALPTTQPPPCSGPHFATTQGTYGRQGQSEHRTNNSAGAGATNSRPLVLPPFFQSNPLSPPPPYQSQAPHDPNRRICPSCGQGVAWPHGWSCRCTDEARLRSQASGRHHRRSYLQEGNRNHQAPAINPQQRGNAPWVLNDQTQQHAGLLLQQLPNLRHLGTNSQGQTPTYGPWYDNTTVQRHADGSDRRTQSDVRSHQNRQDDDDHNDDDEHSDSDR